MAVVDMARKWLRLPLNFDPFASGVLVMLGARHLQRDRLFVEANIAEILALHGLPVVRVLALDDNRVAREAVMRVERKRVSLRDHDG